MTVVVEQSVPWSRAHLDLDSSTRWSKLFPLIRHSVIPAITNECLTFLIDRSHTANGLVRIVPVCRSSNFSNKLLENKHVAASLLEHDAVEGLLAAKEIYQILNANRVATENGLVVIRCGKRRHLEIQGKEIVEVEVEGELQLDHLLSLLGKTSESTGASLQQTTELVQTFLSTAAFTTSSFHTEKLNGYPSVFGEAGHEVFDTAKQALENDLLKVLKLEATARDSVVFSIHYSDINGLSRLENYILAYEINSALKSRNIPYQMSSSALVEDAHGPRGWAVSICPVPKDLLAPLEEPAYSLTQDSLADSRSTSVSGASPRIKFSDSSIRYLIKRGCESVIAAEPTITEYDTIVGDGDCGFTLRDGATKFLELIGSQDLSHFPRALSALVDDLEVTMGGTSGALYCIYLSSLAQELRTASTVPEALTAAQNHLLKYTRARIGDRTCLDCLIPFVETLNRTGDTRLAIEAARKGVDSTKNLEAKLGRSAYLDESATRGVPDPGAYGLLKLLEGLVE